jgi:hypothetical protein
MIASFGTPDRARQFLGSDSAVQRMGVGVNVVLPVPSVADGLRRVFSGLHIQRDASDISDFVLQMNLPTQSAAFEFRLNRLLKWQAVALRVVNMAIGPESRPVTHAFDVPVVRLELDINTPPGYQGSFDASQVSQLIDECFGEAQRVIADGGFST